MRKVSSLLLSLLLVSQFVNAFAQQPSTPAPQPATQQQDSSNPYDDEVVRITTNLVQVDAVVVDKDGRYVTDLRPEDFQVIEDGKRQEITNFSYINVAAEAPTPTSPNTTEPAGKKKQKPSSADTIPPVRLRPEQLRRTVALVIDDLSLSAESMYYVRQTLKNYLDTQVQATDLSAILRTSSGTGVLQQFTSDKRILYAALDRVRWFPRSRGGLVVATAKDPLAEPTDDPGPDASKMGTASQNREENSIADSIDALVYIIRGFQRLPGRKAVILFSDSLRRFSRIDNALSSNSERLRRLVDMANRASVVIYTIDPRGLQPLQATAGDRPGGLTPQTASSMLGPGSPTQSFYEDQDGLNYLAKETGGLFMKDSNDLNRGVQRALEDQKGYYLIGYRPDASTFDQRTGQRRFHNLKVKLNRPGLIVRSRSGFYGFAEPKFTEQPRTPRQQLMEALASPFGASDVDVRMTSLYNNDAAQGSFMRSLIYVNAKDLQFSEEADGSRKASIDIAAVVFNGEGRALEQITDAREIRVTADGYRSIMQNGLTYSLNVPVKQPGSYQLRVAIRDTTSQKTGSANQFISVPDINKGRLVLSGITVAGTDADAASAAGTNQPANNSSGVGEQDPRYGPAVRRLKQGMLLDYGYIIYNAKLDRATNRPQLTTQLRLYRDGKLIFTGRVTPVDASGQMDLKRLMVGGRIQTGAEMVPGDYALQITVTDLLAKEKERTATQWTDFQIVK